MLKQTIKKNPFLYELAIAAHLLIQDFRLSHFKNIFWYFGDLQKVRRGANSAFPRFRFLPYLNDRVPMTPMDPVYFYQNAWMAKKLFELKPEQHFDVGSSANALGMLSQFTPITMVDIRPLPVALENLRFVKGSITSLPFADHSISSLSSLCVVEHIGLGRYGDEPDAFGSEKAIAELQRVTKPGGVILISVPVDKENTVYFNAHRAFTRDYILSLFANFDLLEEKYQYGYELVAQYSRERGFGTGLYMFRKR